MSKLFIQCNPFISLPFSPRNLCLLNHVIQSVTVRWPKKCLLCKLVPSPFLFLPLTFSLSFYPASATWSWSSIISTTDVSFFHPFALSPLLAISIFLCPLMSLYLSFWTNTSPPSPTVVAASFSSLSLKAIRINALCLYLSPSFRHQTLTRMSKGWQAVKEVESRADALDVSVKPVLSFSAVGNTVPSAKQTVWRWRVWRESQQVGDCTLALPVMRKWFHLYFVSL